MTTSNTCGLYAAEIDMGDEDYPLEVRAELCVHDDGAVFIDLVMDATNGGDPTEYLNLYATVDDMQAFVTSLQEMIDAAKQEINR